MKNQAGIPGMLNILEMRCEFSNRDIQIHYKLL